MAFERKKRKIKINTPKTKVKDIKPEIKEKPYVEEETEQTSRVEIIKGSRRKRRIIRIAFYVLLLAVIITLIVLNSMSATGLVEMLQNGYAKSGKGDFPVSIYSQNPTVVYTVNDTVNILNDSYFEVYNSKGKLIQAASHGMSDPVLETSEARFLLFDRGRYNIKIYNYSSFISEQTFEKQIFSAAIGRNGTYAVVTASDSYYATVYVYNKDGDLIYTWNSANYYVFDVAVSNDGKSIALSLIGAEGGTFVSQIYILKYDSATPVFKFTFNALITSLMSANENYFLANGTDSAYTVSWNGSQSNDLKVTGTIRSYRSSDSGRSVITYGRTNNDRINTVKVIDAAGNSVSSFDFNSAIDDIGINETELIVLSDHTVSVFDQNGTQITELLSDVKPLKAVITQTGSIITVDNSFMQRLSASE